MRKKCILFGLLVGMLTSIHTSAFSYAEDYEEIIQKLDNAVANRDYRNTKVYINELLPLIKEDIKEIKKAISAAKKSDVDKDEIAQMTEELDRKKEIYEKFDHLVTTSPAAIRVRVDEIKRLVDELEELTS